MFNKQIFKNQQWKFMVYNLIAFTIIFGIFGIIIFSEVQRTLYSQADKELFMTKERMLESDSFAMPPRNDSFNPPHREKEKGILSPRMIVLQWDNNGNILNKGQIGTLIYEQYLQNFKLDKTKMNEIAMMTIDGGYDFRYILFENKQTDDNIAYTQLLINVDAEQNIIANFEKIIIICAIIFIVLSISASYILSKKMMKPILHSWMKQAEFVENASHELRTPLTIIQNKLEMLLTTPQERIANKFENIALSLSETRRLSKLTSDLLTLARADSAETQLMKHAIDVDAFIQKVCAPYQEIAESQDKYFWLKLDCPVKIEADEVRLHQLLVILLDNALKYTKENDSIGVKTFMEEQKVVVEVSDTGIGIEEENMKYIFDRFYREDKARSRETGGVGLGLSIAQWIVSQHKGTIKVFKNHNKGTTFKIKLPK